MTFLVILFAILLFSLIIFIHELGHFISARIFKVTVHEFAIGMGPAIFSWSGKGTSSTKYSIRCIPIGGYCKMEGEDGDSDSDGSFSSKSKFARFVILASGAFMNIVLGFLISIVVVIATSGNGIATTTIEELVPNSPVSAYIKPGDKIVEINGHSINIKQEIAFALAMGDSETFDIKVERDGKTLEFKNIKPHEIEENGQKYRIIGIKCKITSPGFFTVLREGFYQTIYIGKMIFMSLSMLISGEAAMSDLSGPIGVVDQMQSAVTSSGGGLAGFLNLLFLAGFISVNIGIMNLLPFPALDGGRIFFILIEFITRRRIPPEKEGIVHFIGLILLFGLMIFATWNDIVRIFN